ncbi:hypothetical protein PPL_07636 [Heterostelium album PN500]|uniref:Uncharacterized protein n=1 Tax=Heterostelium pallidum (strain ATCC 26659 / Pp 5 / PN500) TaxID=670386 RepID=D3BGI4_HETP5|nr:hypothetical protein PPL_07636 [Heterostelium album PN500]EFA79584.1 hypothetical protein PPL_07636 [Heterostelium album PN500]|eukprot:XP_020431705.1 hypothetical protein PPL_07636 [Heterostelium album PN500]
MIYLVYLSESIQLFIKKGQTWEKKAEHGNVDEEYIKFKMNINKGDSYEFLMVCNSSLQDLIPRVYSVDVRSDGMEEKITFTDFLNGEYKGETPMKFRWCGYNIFPFNITNRNSMMGGDYVLHMKREDIFVVVLIQFTLSIKIYTIDNSGKWNLRASTPKHDDPYLIYKIEFGRGDFLRFAVVNNESYQDYHPKIYSVDIRSEDSEEKFEYIDEDGNTYSGETPKKFTWCGYNLFGFNVTNKNKILGGDYVLHLKREAKCIPKYKY